MDKTQTKLKKRIETGEIIEQKCWEYIKELNSVSDERLDSVALIDFKRSYILSITFVLIDIPINT